jgi:hypothetical protein
LGRVLGRSGAPSLHAHAYGLAAARVLPVLVPHQHLVLAGAAVDEVLAPSPWAFMRSSPGPPRRRSLPPPPDSASPPRPRTVWVPFPATMRPPPPVPPRASPSPLSPDERVGSPTTAARLHPGGIPCTSRTRRSSEVRAEVAPSSGRSRACPASFPGAGGGQEPEGEHGGTVKKASHHRTLIHRSAWKARVLRSPLVPRIFAPAGDDGEKTRSASHNGPDTRRSDVAKVRTPWPSSSTRR